MITFSSRNYISFTIRGEKPLVNNCFLLCLSGCKSLERPLTFRFHFESNFNHLKWKEMVLIQMKEWKSCPFANQLKIDSFTCRSSEETPRSRSILFLLGERFKFEWKKQMKGRTKKCEKTRRRSFNGPSASCVVFQFIAFRRSRQKQFFSFFSEIECAEQKQKRQNHFDDFRLEDKTQKWYFFFCSFQSLIHFKW